MVSFWRLTAVACVILLGASTSSREMLAQEKTHSPSSVSPAQTPVLAQVGLIDMDYLFRHSKQFKVLSQQLEKDLAAVSHEAQTRIEAMNSLRSEIERVTFQRNHSDFEVIRTRLTTAEADFETFRKASQIEFLKKEAKLYQAVYVEIEKAVRQYAELYRYTLVIKFSRLSKIEVAERNAEQDPLRHQNIIYSRAEDDLTLPILNYLNSNWAEQEGNRLNISPAVRQASSQTLKPLVTTHKEAEAPVK